MKAILVAGGHGSRLLPFTRYTHKTLLPLHKRPVIDYALDTIRRSGIKDIIIIGNQFIEQISQHVGEGRDGETIHYVVEQEPLGVHHAISLARPLVEGSRLLVYFSDNITTWDLSPAVADFSAATESPGCALLCREVADPERFGVAVFDENGELSDIIEKPQSAPSNFAIGGIYLFDESFWRRMDSAYRDKGSNFSISDVNRDYLRDGKVTLHQIGQEIWLDCGTPDSLLEAATLAKSGRLPLADEGVNE
jgi:glucose-1-phosphate thymidylyltransferase